MRALVILFVGCATYVQAASAETWRVRDVVTFSSEASGLLGGRTKAATTTTSRLITSIDTEPGAWTVTYEGMTLNSVAVPNASGRSYKVRPDADGLVVEPLSPTDGAGLAGVRHDLKSVEPLLSGGALCPNGVVGLCPSVRSLLQNIGEVVVLDAADPKVLRISVTSTTGESLLGTVRLESAKWTVDLEGGRTDQISYAAGGSPGVEEAESKCRYQVIREVLKE